MKVTLTTYPEVEYAEDTVSHDQQTFHFFNEDGTPGMAIASAQWFGDELPFLAEAGDILDIDGHWNGHGAFIINLDDGEYQDPPHGKIPAEALGLHASPAGDPVQTRPAAPGENTPVHGPGETVTAAGKRGRDTLPARKFCAKFQYTI